MMRLILFIAGVVLLAGGNVHASDEKGHYELCDSFTAYFMKYSVCATGWYLPEEEKVRLLLKIDNKIYFDRKFYVPNLPGKHSEHVGIFKFVANNIEVTYDSGSVLICTYVKIKSFLVITAYDNLMCFVMDSKT